eukprot:CAMPEP_0115434294 /NCGR_PEP_ID=MMETSP0271-20121206/33069_1 /TAXON_ID=71861 /ORGANISM="Scrippsiella trochoidea, Strain CCMP3099" /LENGTH=732 /DNA_ID=CAMNT_0002859715 /DNA_START=101 /DNA_END=2296 /DNA_ORIENTATION=-
MGRPVTVLALLAASSCGLAPSPSFAAAVKKKAAGDGGEEGKAHKEEAKEEEETSRWYDGLENVKVLRPEDKDLQDVVDDIWGQQEGWKGHFNGHRYAVLLTPGSYPEDFVIPVSYYTSVLGVGAGPYDVQVQAVRSLNGANGHATNNFWRSVEGVHLKNATVTWAVSQGAPIRRSVVDGHLFLSDHKGFSSGGFIADVKMHGTVMAGMQQQWLFRNMDMTGGIWCPTGWNYVFVGVKDMMQKTYTDCAGPVTGKVTVAPTTPRIAEKPYLVQAKDDEDGGGKGEVWSIYVPQFHRNGTAGATQDHEAAAARKLRLVSEVFVAKPGQSAEEINKGMKGKKGLLLTPGLYELDRPLIVSTDGFVVLGIGFPTLVATDGRSAVEVAHGLTDVRVAGLLLEAGTPASRGKADPLLRWGEAPSKAEHNGSTSNSSGSGPAGVMSDIFARVGSFHYRGCHVVRADTMVEINSDDVVLDNTWLWHADHDDCGTDPGNSLNVTGKSDECISEHGLVVNGARTTAYGTAAEHMTKGDMVSWRGEKGEAYFYQSELPYHNDGYSSKGYVAYAVAPGVKEHLAYGMGVYIISGKSQSKGGFILPSTARAENLMTVVVIGHKWQFKDTLCLRQADGDGEEQCVGPTSCVPETRCVVRTLPSGSTPPASLFFLAGRPEEVTAASGGGAGRLPLFAAASLAALIALAALSFAVARRPQHLVGGGAGAFEMRLVETRPAAAAARRLE